MIHSELLIARIVDLPAFRYVLSAFDKLLVCSPTLPRRMIVVVQISCNIVMHTFHMCQRLEVHLICSDKWGILEGRELCPHWNG